MAVGVPELPISITIWGIKAGTHVVPWISNSGGRINQIVRITIIFRGECRS